MENNNELLNDIKSYIIKVNDRLENIIDDIRIENKLDELADFIEGLLYCVRGLILINVDIDIDEININNKIEEILEALENQDYNLIADILEYEVLEIVEDLNTELKNI